MEAEACSSLLLPNYEFAGGPTVIKEIALKNSSACEKDCYRLIIFLMPDNLRKAK